MTMTPFSQLLLQLVLAGWIVLQETSAFGIPPTPTRQSLSTRPQASSTHSVSADNNNKARTSDDASTLTLFSPCKINLFLRILRKRQDGFHDLASLFQAVGFGDTLELTPLEQDGDGDGEDTFECNMAGVPTDGSNLVLRALSLMRDKTNVQQYFHANLQKSVPAQAGLGGGSANAATAMFGANQLMGRPATLEQLVEWSAELGSDITFFLSRGTAYCTGRGEIMTPIDPPLPAGTKVCLVKPENIGLSTPAVFKALNYDELSPLDPQVLLDDFIKHGVEGVDASRYLNDLEPPAFRCVPELEELKRELQQVKGFRHVMMSGSGTTIFCIGEPENKEAFEEQFGKREGLQVFASEFINREDGVWFERPVNS